MIGTGLRAVTTDDAGVLSLWDTDNQKEILRRACPRDLMMVRVDNGTVRGLRRNGTIVVIREDETHELLKVPGATVFSVSDRYDRLIIGSSKGVVEVYDLGTDRRIGRKITTFRKHAGGITTLTNYVDGTILSGGTDQLVYHWRSEDGNEINCLEGHDGEITHISTLGVNLVLTAAGRTDGTARVWDLESGRELRIAATHQTGFKTAVVQTASRLFTLANDGTLQCWSLLATEKPVEVIGRNRLSPLPVFDFSMGQYSSAVLAAGDSGILYLVDLEAGEVAATMAADGDITGLYAY